MMRVSILLCSYKRPDMLRMALDALVTHTTTKPAEIVVVIGSDTGSDPLADQVIKDITPAAQEFGILLVPISVVNKSLATSRNVGIAHWLASSTADVLAMTDDDAEVFPDWIERLVTLHAAHPEAGAIGGAVIGADSAANNHTSFISRLADAVTFPRYAKACYVRTLPGVNVSYKRDVIARVGPQDETLARGEDVDFNWRVQLLDYNRYKIYYDPDLKVLHHHRPTLSRFFRQHYMYGRSYVLVRRKWPAMYCIYPHQINNLKALLKAINFFAAAFYEPFLLTRRFNRWADKLLAISVLMINQIVWRGGMILQMIESRRA
jgi:GT2 family glycosyltransferase